MWKISPEALAYVWEHGGEATVGLPVTVTGCCMHITEAPEVRLGKPVKPQGYVRLDVQDAALYVPADLADSELSLELVRFFRRQRLVVEGWKVL